jgi:divalent metal cation (Fe/Co/Zn/Cd) transporter
VDLHVQADPGMSLRDAHALSGRVKAAIKATVPAVFDTSIHTEPFEPPAAGSNALLAEADAGGGEQAPTPAAQP